MLSPVLSVITITTDNSRPLFLNDLFTSLLTVWEESSYKLEWLIQIDESKDLEDKIREQLPKTHLGLEYLAVIRKLGRQPVETMRLAEAEEILFGI